MSARCCCVFVYDLLKFRSLEKASVVVLLLTVVDSIILCCWKSISAPNHVVKYTYRYVVWYCFNRFPRLSRHSAGVGDVLRGKGDGVRFVQRVRCVVLCGSCFSQRRTIIYLLNIL